MKLPAPSMVGQENVLDFRAPRARASGELKELLRGKSNVEVASELKTAMAERATERLARMRGLTPEQHRDEQIARTVTKISEAMQVIQRSLKTMQTHYSEAALDAYIVGLQEMLPKLTGGRCE